MRVNREDTEKKKKKVNGGKMNTTNLFPLSNGIVKRNKKNIIVTLGEFRIP